jgi:hypothetical protein
MMLTVIVASLRFTAVGARAKRADKRREGLRSGSAPSSCRQQLYSTKPSSWDGPSSSVRALLQRSIESRFDRPENQRRLCR